MNKNIYVYFRDYDYLEEFKNHPDFIAPNEYNIEESYKLLRDEYGTLRLKKINIKLILDSGIEKKCPWCNHSEQEIKTISSFDKQIIRFFAECPNCLARGPVLNVPECNLIYKKIEEESKEYVIKRWCQRIPRKIEITGEK